MATWILVADESRARLFQSRTRWAALEEIASFANPDARVPARDLEADRPTRSADHGAGQRSAYEPRTRTGQKVAMQFAELIADRLEAGRVAHEYDELIVAAAPRFLGLLRKAVTPNVGQLVARTIDKDITAADVETIRHQITAG